MDTVVIDASVGLKWFLRQEEDRDKARFLLKQFAEGKIKFIVPTIWLYEIANAFKSNVAIKKITRVTAKKYLKKLKDLEVVSIDFEAILDIAFNLSAKLDISIYDAAYIALSKLQNFPFYTADQKLLDKIPVNFTNAHHIVELNTETN